MFSPRSSLHRVPLSSHRNTNNFAPPAPSAGLRLPQATASSSSQHQLLQQTGTTLYSPRVSNSSAHQSNFSISPRGTLRGSRREFAPQLSLGRSNHSSLPSGVQGSTAAQQAAHAAAAANRPGAAQFKQLTQQQSLFSPRHDKHTANGALTARTNLQHAAEVSKSAKHAQHGTGSLTWRAQHAQQEPGPAAQAEQPVQQSTSNQSPTRSHYHLLS